VHRRLALSCATAATVLALAACGDGGPSATKQVASAHPTWITVAQVVCPPGSDATGSVDEHEVACTSADGRHVGATFYDKAVDLDRTVSTFRCRTGVKSISGDDWLVPVVADDATAAKLLDAGGINLC
jgi:hypothetical protein